VTRILDPRNAAATFIGVFQSLLGISAMIATYLIYFNPDFFAIRTMLNLRQEYISLYIMILFVIGLFAIISGLLIIYEWSSRS
jgi:uncharacterized membrane protein YGL010W